MEREVDEELVEEEVLVHVCGVVVEEEEEEEMRVRRLPMIGGLVGLRC